MTMIFEVIQGHNIPVPKKMGDKEKLIQDMYMHKGGPFPEKISQSWDSAHECLPVGKYTLCPSSFRANQYGSLELDRWNLKFLPVDENLKKVS